MELLDHSTLISSFSPAFSLSTNLTVCLLVYLYLSLSAKLQEVGIIPMMLFSDVLPSGGGTAIAEGNQGRLAYLYNLTFTNILSFIYFTSPLLHCANCIT